MAKPMLVATTALIALSGCSIATGGNQLLAPPDQDSGPAADASPSEVDAGMEDDAVVPPADARVRLDAGRDASDPVEEDAGADAGPAWATCDDPVDVTAGGSFVATTCEGDHVDDCSSGPSPERWYEYRGTMARFEVSPGYRLIISTDPCGEPLMCVESGAWERTAGEWTAYLGVERVDGSCGAFTLTVDLP